MLTLHIFLPGLVVTVGPTEGDWSQEDHVNYLRICYVRICCAVSGSDTAYDAPRKTTPRLEHQRTRGPRRYYVSRGGVRGSYRARRSAVGVV